MNVLIACEESQRVCTEFRKLGANAYSCDILETSGNHPEWHIKDSVIPLLNGNCSFTTQDGVSHTIKGRWDAIIAFPPCTHLAVSGARHFEQKRKDGRQKEGIEFFLTILEANCEFMCVENPTNIITGGSYIREWFPEYSSRIKDSTQIIQPYFFGDTFKKTTHLWLKGLPNLIPTDIVKPQLVHYVSADGSIKTFSADYSKVGKNRSTQRSKTYPGIAKAMASQWYPFLQSVLSATTD